MSLCVGWVAMMLRTLQKPNVSSQSINQRAQISVIKQTKASIL